MPKTGEDRKNEIARRLTDLAVEESRLLINRPLGKLIRWSEYEKRTDEIDTERTKLRKELFDLCTKQG